MQPVLKPGDVVTHTLTKTGGWGWKIGDTMFGTVQQVTDKRVEVYFRTASKSYVKRWFLPDTWRKA